MRRISRFTAPPSLLMLARGRRLRLACHVAYAMLASMARDITLYAR